tara:strand:+ start:396 stop:611 length:216 start_codon:yes stop_codon:yes gene_type:complete
MQIKRKQYIMTKSNDGCVVIVQASNKTDDKDIFISEEVLQRNLCRGTFCEHERLKHNNSPIYVLTEDLKRQ